MSDIMTQCPTCGAKGIEGPSCHRCQTDLRQVQDVERAAAWCRNRATEALKQARRHEARDMADRACALHRSDDSLSLRAIIAIAEGEFDLALRLWRETQAGLSGRPGQAGSQEGIPPNLDA